MGFRLTTSSRTKDIFDDIGSRTNLKPFALSKIALSLSLAESTPVNEKESDTKGLDLNRQTITAQYDTLYKCLIEQKEGKHLTDDEYFPYYVKLHIDRGAEILRRQYEYTGNLEKFINLLMNGGMAI
jgi:DNA sulfur modification protein DndE